MGRFMSSADGCIAIEPVSSSTDHFYPKITSILEEQENRAGSARDTNTKTVVNENHRLNFSELALGSVLNFPKSRPQVTSRINMWANIDPINNTVLEPTNHKFRAQVMENDKYFRV
jgi:hypothetical protein